MAAHEEDSVDIVFHGAAYNLHVTVEPGSPEPSLAIDLEELATGSSWHGEFTASYIENTTSKTGSFKRFGVLVKMLLGALRRQSESVFLDLLTYADLEALKSRKAAKAAGGATAAAPPVPSAASKTLSNKRYLILTYVAEFDRVHYPLPLAFLEAPSVPALSRLVRRLRTELPALQPPCLPA